MSSDALIDRRFAEKFLRSVDHPLDYGVYLLFHEWWAEAPQRAIDAYAEELASLDGAKAFFEARYLAAPLSLERLAECAPGTLGHGYRAFIVEHHLEANLGRNYRDFNEQLSASGKLDRLPAEMSYTIVRGFQIHDFLHVLTGFDSGLMGELSQAAFHFAQLRYPYHAMRVAVTTAHMAFLNPGIITDAMDALVAGWSLGRTSRNLHFERWEDQLDTPVAIIRERMGLEVAAEAA